MSEASEVFEGIERYYRDFVAALPEKHQPTFKAKTVDHPIAEISYLEPCFLVFRCPPRSPTRGMEETVVPVSRVIFELSSHDASSRWSHDGKFRRELVAFKPPLRTTP